MITSYMKKTILKGIITFIFSLLAFSLLGQNINLIRFNNTGNFTPGSGVSVIINPTGIFELNNQFILQLSGVNGSWTTPITLTTLNEFYVPVINGTLPASLTAGSYKLRVISTLPKDTVETASFNVISGNSIGIPNFKSNLYNATNAQFTCLGNCSPNSNIFGQLNVGVGEQTSQINEDDRNNYICEYDSSNSYKVTLINISNNQTKLLSIKTDGSFIVPNDLAIGTYIIELEKLKNGISTIYSNIFLFHGNSTGLNNLSAETVCVGNSVSWSIDNTLTTGIGRNYLGSKYQINFGDGSPIEYYTHAQLIQSGQIDHTFNSVSCSAGTPGSPNQGYYIIQIKLFNKGVYNSGNNPDYCNSFYENGNGADKRVNTSKAPIADFTLNKIQCIQSAITANNTTILGQYGTTTCLNTPRYYWAYKKPSSNDFITVSSSSSWISNGNLTIPTSELEPGCWEIRLRAQNAGAGCVTTTEKIKTIKIEAEPTPSFNLNPQSPICAGTTINFTNTSNVLNLQCQEPTYNWTVTPVVGTPATSNGYSFNASTNSSSKDPKILFTQPGSYNVVLAITNSCGTYTSSTKTIEVLGDPTVSFNPTSASICVNAPADYTVDFSTTYKPNYSKAPYAPVSYEWSISGAGVTASDYEFTGGTTSASAYPKIIFKAYKTFAVKVKVNGNCNGANEATFTLTLKEIPVITNSNLTQTICSGTSSSAIPLTSSVTTGTTFSWVVNKTTNITTPINNGTSTPIPGITINNNSTTSGTVTYTVTPTANACAGSSKNFVITVNPIPVISNLTSTICSGNEFDATPSNGNGNIVPSGTTYSWADPVSNPIGAITGGSAQSDQNTISQTLTNTTNAPATLTYTVTPKSGASGSCDGQPFTVTVTVNPTPTLTQPENQVICSNLNTQAITFNSNVVNTTYTWSNTNTTIGLGASGTGNINTFKATNTGITPQTATITVTPTANGCPGASKPFTITVNPTPKISNKTMTICSGENFSLSPTNGNGGDIVPANTTYSWSEPEPQTGISGLAAGTNTTIISGTLQNTSTSPKTIVYTITPTAGAQGNCSGQTFTLSVTVNPKPVSLALTNKDYCNGTAVPQLNLNNSVSGTTYTWTNSNPAIGLAASSTGNITSIPAFTATNNTSNSITATIKLYPTFTNGDKSCTGAMEEFDITVNPAAVVLFSKGNQTKCSGETTDEVILSSATNNVTFNWTATKPTGITGPFVNSGTNTIPAQTLENTTNAPIDIIYSATGTVAGGTNCIGAPSTYIITINPKPQINTTIEISSCSGNAFTFTPPTSGNTIPTGTTYSWENPTLTGGMTGGASGSNLASITGTLTNPTNTSHTATYLVTPRANACDGTPFTVIVTVNPKPVIANKSLTVCSGTNFTVELTDPTDIILANTSYTWGIPTVTGSLTGGVSGTNQASFSGNLTNTTNSNQTATYSVTPTSGSTGNCPGNPFTITITVKPALKATISTSSTDACLNSISPTVTLTGMNGTPPYTFTYKLNGGADINLQTTGVANTATINVPTTSVTSNTYSLVKISDASSNACTETVTGNVSVNVTDVPVITTVQNQTICSGTEFNISPTNGGGNIVPTGTTYTWSAPTISPSAGAITGGTAQSVAQSSIKQLLTNTTDQIATATYTVTPKAGLCSGATFQVVITVNPAPKVIFSDADNKQALCSGGTSEEVNLSSLTTGNISFSWTANVPTGITGAITTGNNTIPPQTLSNSTNAPLDIIYSARANLNNSLDCHGSIFDYKITVYPVAKVNTVNNVTLCNNENSTVIAFGSNVTGTTYKWENDNTSIGLAATGIGNLPVFTAINTGLSPIVANITVTPTANGCEGIKSSFIITINPTPTVDKPSDQIVCNGFTTTDVIFTGNINTATYNWTNDKPGIGLAATGTGNIPSFTAINTGATAITATITVTPVDGCSGNPKTFTITVNPSPAFTQHPQSESLCIDGTAKILSVSHKNGTGTPSYQWYSNTLNDNTNGTLIPNAISDSYAPPTNTLGTMYYYCIITFSEGGCSEIISNTAAVTVNPLLTISKEPLDAESICVGGTVNAFNVEYSGGSGTATYQWYRNSRNDNSSGSPITGAVNASFTPPASDFLSPVTVYYYVIVSLNGSGCGSATSNTAKVVVVPDPVVNSQPLDSQTVCQNTTPTTLELTASGGLGNFSYQWFSNTNNANSGGNPINGATQNTFIPPTSVVGTIYYYCVISQTAVGCQVNSEVAAVTVVPAPVINQQPQSATVCLNGTTPNLTVKYANGTGTPSYQWYSNTIDNNTNGTLILNAISDSYAPPTNIVGTLYYYCIITFSEGGCSSIVSETAKVTVNQYPVISDFFREIGSGQSFMVLPVNNATDIVPEGTLYTWTISSIDPLNSVTGASPQTIGQNQISQTLTNNTNTKATVIYDVKPVSGVCEGETFKITVVIFAPIVITPEIKQISCYGVNDGEISVTIEGGSPPYSIQWTGPDNFQSDKLIIENLKPGKYNLTIEDEGGSLLEQEFTVIEPEIISIQTIKEKNISCYGKKDGEIILNISGGNGGYVYKWTRNEVDFDNSQNLVNIPAGNYNISVTDSNNCEHATQDYTLTQPDPLNIELINITHNLCAGDSNGSIEINVTGGTPKEIQAGIFGYTYLWTGPNGFFSKNNNISNLTSGIYSLNVTDNSGCSTDLDFTIEEPDRLVALATKTDVSCYEANDGTILLDVVGGVDPYIIKWDNLANGYFITNLAPGSYSASIIDTNQCTTSVDVEIKDAPFVIKPTVKHISCFSKNDGSISLNIQGGISPIKVNWEDDLSAGHTRYQLSPGTYTVLVTDAASCPIRKTFTIIEPLALTAEAQVKNAFDCDTPNSGAINLIVSGGTEPYKYKWSNGSDTQNLQNIQAGKYEVEITDINGCSVTKLASIMRQQLLNLSIMSNTDYTCETGEMKAFNQAEINGGMPPYTISWSSGEVSGINNQNMTASTSGTYSVTVIDALDCKTSKSFEIKIPNVGINHNMIDCNSKTYQFKALIPYGEANDYSFIWDFGDGKASDQQNIKHIYDNPGAYNVKLTIKNDMCETIFNKKVEVYGPPKLLLEKDPIMCYSDSIWMKVSGANSYRWFNGASGDSILIKKSGIYNVIGTNEYGCSSNLNFSINYYDNFIYDIFSNKNSISLAEPDIKLWSQDIAFSSYKWDFGDGNQAQGNHQDYLYKIVSHGYYDVNLYVVNPYGCLEKATKRIWITNKSTVNTFSPNGDGIDDVFMQGWDIKVYNRNGVLMYEGMDGWDGTYKGKPASNDTYFYVIYYLEEKGLSTEAGYITIIR